MKLAVKEKRLIKENAKDVLESLKEIRGVLSEKIDGVKYENKIRKEAESHWKKLKL